MVKKIAEKFNRLSRVHRRHRQTTDGRLIAYSDREREFTFAKNVISARHIIDHYLETIPGNQAALSALL